MRSFVFLLLASLAGAQAPQQTAAPTEPPKKARIEGSIVSVTGEAVPRAQVRLTGAANIQNGQLTQGAAFAATTGDDGKFVMDNIDPGRSYRLNVQRPGFVSTSYGARSTSTPGAALSLEAGQVLKGISISMTPQGVISGKITDQSGDPVQGVMVAIMRRSYQRGSRQLQPQGTSSTNDQGEFRAANLAPGRYYVVATGSRIGLPGQAQGKTANATTYYPNASEPQGAAPIDITPGAELRGVDIRLRQTPVFSIRGKAVDANGAPVIGTLISSSPAGDQGTSILTAFTRYTAPTRAPDGSFEIANLPAGTHTLQVLPNVTINGAAGPKVSGRLDVTVADADVAGVTFLLTPGAVLNGTVRLEDGDISKLLQPVTGTTPQSPVSAAILGLAGISGGGMVIALVDQTSGSSAPPTSVKPDGTFVLEGVLPSKFQLNVVGLPQGHYVKSATFGGADVTKSLLDFSSGAGGTLNIVISSKAADVTGVVRPQKEESVVGVAVTLWPRDPQPGAQNNGIKTAFADQNGGFTFSNLAPGVYYAAAWEDIEPGLAQWRDFTTMFASDAGKLELVEGAHAATEIKLIPIAKIKAGEEKLP